MAIVKSVGEGGINQLADVRFVQLLLADWLVRNGHAAISIDGINGPQTVAAIRTFQEAVTGVADGRVDPDGPTIIGLQDLHVRSLEESLDGALPQPLPVDGDDLTEVPNDLSPYPYFFAYLRRIREGFAPSVPTNTVRQKLDDQIQQTQQVSLLEAISDVGDAHELLRRTIGRDALIIQNPHITGSDERISLAGRTKLFGAMAADYEVIIEQLNSDEAAITIANPNPAAAPSLVDFDDSLFGGAFVAPTRLESLSFEALTIRPTQGEVAVSLRGSQDISIGGGTLTLKRPTLSIDALGGLGTSPHISARVRATIEFAEANFVLEGEFDPNATALASIDIRPAAGGFPSFQKLLTHFLPSAPELPADLAVKKLELSKFLNTNAFTLAAVVDGGWEFELGATARAIRNISLRVTSSADDVTASIRGSIDLLGSQLEVSSAIGEVLVVSGQLPSVDFDLNDAVKDLIGNPLPLPNGIAAISVPGGAKFQISFADDSTEFLLQSPLRDGAELRAIVKKVGGDWESAVAVVPPEDWEFSDISTILRPFDVLDVSVPVLAYSTFAEERLTLPGLNSTSLSLQVKQGFVLSSSLKLHGVGLDFLAKLIGRDELPLQLAVADDISKAEIEAALEENQVVVPGVVTFRGFTLSLKPNPFVVAFACIADVNIFGEDLPTFAVETAIVENDTRLSFQTLEPWESPFGLSGLTINQVVLQVETAPVPKFGVLGDIAIKDKRVRMAAQFTNNAPSMIAGELIGTLSLSETVDDLVGLRLPTDLLDISISDFKIRVVADPTGVTIGDETFDPGLALQGTMGFLGMSLFVKVVVDPDSGVFAHGALSDRVNIGNVLIVSDAEGAGPPSITLNTSRSPFLEITAAIQLLGLRESIEATVDSSGFEFTLTRNLVIAKYSLTCKAKPPIDFSGRGTFSFGIDESIGPIQLAPGTPSLGRIALKAGFAGDLSINVSANGFMGTAKGGFQFQGMSFKVPELRLSVAPQDIEEFPRRVVREIVDNAEDIFSELFEDADKWLLAIRDKVITEVENIAAALKKHFVKDTKYIADAIQNKLGQGAEAAAKGLRSIGESAENIAGALKDVGEAGEDLANRVGDALSKAGFPDAAVKDALDTAFGGGVEWPPHVKLPHAKHVKLPHAKHVKLPHAKHVKLPHAKHVKLPHAKHVKLPHAKHVKLPHAKHVKLPHAKHVKLPHAKHAKFF